MRWSLLLLLACVPVRRVYLDVPLLVNAASSGPYAIENGELNLDTLYVSLGTVWWRGRTDDASATPDGGQSEDPNGFIVGELDGEWVLDMLKAHDLGDASVLSGRVEGMELRLNADTDLRVRGMWSEGGVDTPVEIGVPLDALVFGIPSSMVIEPEDTPSWTLELDVASLLARVTFADENSDGVIDGLDFDNAAAIRAGALDPATWVMGGQE